MHNITELNVLLRARTELPPGLKLETSEFSAGWDFIRHGRASGLEKKVQKRQWHFIRIADESLQSGIGETSRQAIAGALKLALRSISAYFNAVEIRRIHLTKYPWFVLARVGVYPIRIQQSAVQSVPDDALPIPVSLQKKRQLPVSAPWLSPGPDCRMALLKEMLISSRSTHERAP
jgi:hypothetical protein